MKVQISFPGNQQKSAVSVRWPSNFFTVWLALQACGLSAQTPEVFSPTSLFPPANGAYYTNVAPTFAQYAGGIMVRRFQLGSFSQHTPPPPPGGSQTMNFAAQCGFELSIDGGATYQNFQNAASVSVWLGHSAAASGTNFYDAELLALNISGGTLPAGMLFRESPTLASTGTNIIRAVTGGYMISGFFNVRTELSTDGGASWFPSIVAPGTLVLTTNLTTVSPIALSCSSNITATTTTPGGIIVLYTNSASGGCAPLSVVGNPPSGSVFPLGTTTVTTVASDGCGNSTNCSFTVTVKLPPPGDFDADGIVSQSEFEAVYTNYLQTSSWLRLTNVAGLGGTNVTFSLTNFSLGSFSVEYSTNLEDWSFLGLAAPRYLFTDTNAPALPQRYYRLRWP